MERDGAYLKGSLLIFHEEAIKAIEEGARKEISLGYKCRLDPTPGVVNGKAYDAIQRDIIVNHVAIGPKGWGRAGPDCSIRADSQKSNKGQSMTETIRLDGVEIALTADNIKVLVEKHKKEFEALKGRLDAIGLELEKEKLARAALENPTTIEERVQSRLNLMAKCRRILGDDVSTEGKTDEELKLLGIKKFHPNIDLSAKNQSYIDGMFEALSETKSERNDSLIATRQAISSNTNISGGYEKWLEQSSKLWTAPLAGSVR